jgi:hypothetical protein
VQDILYIARSIKEKYNKENCENHNREWIGGECHFYENQMKEGWEVDEDNFYKKYVKMKRRNQMNVKSTDYR